MTAASERDTDLASGKIIKHGFDGPPLTPVENENRGGGRSGGGKLVRLVISLALLAVPVGVFFLTYASHR